MEKKVVLLILILPCFSVACANIVAPEAPTIAELFSGSGVPGVSIAVIKDFRIDFLEVHGVKDKSTGQTVTVQTRFQAASLSKSVAAMGALKFVLDGKISLDENVNLTLLSWRVPENHFTETEKVTLKRLLGHTAGTTVQGFPGYSYDVPLPTLLQVLNGESPANTQPVVVFAVPDSTWSYSGGGYCIVQQLLIDVEKKDFPEIMRSTVLAPLAMQHSTYEQPLPAELSDVVSAGHLSNGTTIAGKYYTYPEMAAAGLWTTPEDLALFLIELQLSLKGQSNKILRTEFAELMMTSSLAIDYALGLEIMPKGREIYFGHGGGNSGFRCLMVAHISQGVGAVVMTNSDAGFTLAKDIIEHIGSSEHWPGY
jgi:CubicO group peptidase (beta-lactamase class C family)